MTLFTSRELTGGIHHESPLVEDHSGPYLGLGNIALTYVLLCLPVPFVLRRLTL